MKKIDGAMYRAMVTNGYRDLMSHCKYVNDLNVFPVPDGDTGINMSTTINGGLDYIKEIDSNSIGEVADQVGKGMLMSARGNSGVILSQFFAGLAEGLSGKDEVTVPEFASALECGVKSAYSVVVKPVEGTILTVMREGVSEAKDAAHFDTSFGDFFTILVKRMQKSLDHTPELLPILKEAGVIDSGGAGLVFIIEGMGQAIGGKIIEDVSFDLKLPTHQKIDNDAFNADSELDYGYCTEFIMQLLNNRQGPEKFDINKLIAYYQTLGDSLVAFQKGTIVKVHVHTKTPSKVIDYAQQFGEFVTFKMENMALQHNETIIDKSRHIAEAVKPEIPHAASACVAVVTSENLQKQFKEYGATVVINAGINNNPGAEDFLNAYHEANADEIIVLPDNGNSMMAAKQAAKMYGEEKIHILNAKSIAQGYAAISIIDLADLSLEDNIERMNAAINNAVTLEFSKASRDAHYDGVEIKKDDNIGIVNGKIVSSNAEFLDTFFESISTVDGVDDMSILTLLTGKDFDDSSREVIESRLGDQYPLLELCFIDAGQAIYTLICTLE
ncbi:MAG: DAK2 domain-containing protein [Bacilli bacterium]|nr:DAK2 domain-containing protein [Bacilli bacterium]